MEPEVVEPEKKRRGRKRKRVDLVEANTKVVATRAVKLVGRYVRKEFEGSGEYLGKITSYDAGLYRVVYEDGDFEDFYSREARGFLVEESELNGEWSEKKQKLDESLISKELADKAPKEEKLLGENVSDANPTNVDVSGNNVATVCTGDDKDANAEPNGDADADPYSSDSSEETDEQAAIVEVEVPLVPPPELPVSSGHIGIPDGYVSHLFSVYRFLRSFSTVLFLYPFGLDDFVGALNCPVANTLLDSVHVALMRILKIHLERLPTDGSEIAAKCLSLLDWSLLDTVTWPVFLAHYLTVMGYRDGPDWKSFYAHSLHKDYYTLPAGRKLINLQILCDNVLDSDELRAEMDMREESEVGIDIDSSLVLAPAGPPKRVHPRYSKTSACKGREAVQSMAGHGEKYHPGPTRSSIDEDGNGDDCLLCGMDGFLLCCDGCPSSYHSRCLGLSKLQVPSGSWYCPDCQINETEPKVSQATALSGGENFGVDPYGQVFVATCDHLLVLTTLSDSQNCVRYYNRHDVHRVLHTLCTQQEHVIMYSEICRGIMQHWGLPQEMLPSSVQIAIPSTNAEGGGDLGTQLVNVLDESVTDITKNESTGSSVSVSGPLSVTSVVAKVTRSCVKPNDRNASLVPRGGCLYMGSSFKIYGYINNYSHGDFAASAAAALSNLSSEENHGPQSRASDNRRKAMSASILIQVKAFSSAALSFIWPSTEKKLVEVPRERCSWCFSCKAQVSSRRGCLLNAAASSATRGAMKVHAGVRLMKNGDGRLPGIATYIMFMEESLSGLVGGPFLNENFRKVWRRQVEQASAFSTIKFLLLKLEENIRPIALSGDWLKLIDGGSTQAIPSQASHSVASAQKRKPGRRGRKSAAVIENTADDSEETSPEFTWWRGGTLSKLMFHRGAFPCSLLRNAARQGGSKKIPGTHYVEGQQIPKTSRQLIWRSAVEMSRNTSQLGLQVRYLDFYVRWSELVRPDQTPTDGKGPGAEASAFRNAVICDKKVCEREIRYCVAFGIQKHLPSRLLKSILETEKNPDDGEERYWFSETRIPLYLIKEYEQKAKVTEPLDELSKLQRKQCKAPHKNKLLLLLRKHNNMVSCCLCNQDVMHRDAIKCNACQGLCHDQCTSSSTVHTNGEVENITMCKKCSEARIKQLQIRKESPTSPLLLKIKLPNTNAAKKPSKIPVHKGSTSSVKAREHSSGEKVTNASASANRSKIKNWGLTWRKPTSEDTGIDFRLKHILHKGNPNMELIRRPSCRLCQLPYNGDLMYIRCEACENWYHADALDLDESQVFSLMGFKCCKCRRIRSPECPYAEKKVGAEKGEHKRSNIEMDSDIFGQHRDFGTAYAFNPDSADDIQISADEPLISLSDLDQCTEGNSEIDYACSNSTVFAPGPRKLPVRRQNKQLNGRDCAFPADPFQVQMSPPFEQSATNSKLPVRRHKNMGTNNMECYTSTVPSKIEPLNPLEPDDSDVLNALSPQIQWDVSNENFDDGITLDYDYDDMEFEPQTYFSFNELLESGDGSRPAGSDIQRDVENWENGSMEIPYNQDEPFTSVDADMPLLVNCKMCSRGEPFPNLYCKVCGVWIHSHCSPWVEEETPSEDGWKCGNCREWK